MRDGKRKRKRKALARFKARQLGHVASLTGAYASPVGNKCWATRMGIYFKVRGVTQVLAHFNTPGSL